MNDIHFEGLKPVYNSQHIVKRNLSSLPTEDASLISVSCGTFYKMHVKIIISSKSSLTVL